MILILLAALIIGLAWKQASDKPLDKVFNELIRYGAVLVAWLLIGGGLFNLLAIFLIAQAIYTPALNYWTKQPIWFIDNNTWLGSQIIKHLGEDSGRVWFFVQLITAILILVI